MIKDLIYKLLQIKLQKEQRELIRLKWQKAQLERRIMEAKRQQGID